MSYPTPEVAFILGPQIRTGSAANPWPWYDSNELAKGLQHCTKFPTYAPGSDGQTNGTYYDLGLTLYLAYYRSGDSRFLDCARQVTDLWWQTPAIAAGTTSPESSWAPRNISLGGLMLRALDGRPEMWPWITRYVRDEYNIWIGLRLAYPELHYGVRDGGYMLQYAAWLAATHPDPAVRAEFRQKALDGAVKYYARLQYADGGWYWRFDEDGSYRSQPFMIGLLLDGLIAVHRLTGEAQVAQAITRSVDWLWTYAYRKNEPVSNVAGATWRSMWYFVWDNHKTWGDTMECHCGDQGIRESRENNPTTMHAFGYAYKLTGNTKYRDWGDEVFAASEGGPDKQGPLTDGYYGLGDYLEKQYNQNYRSGGHYLAWRLGY